MDNKSPLFVIYSSYRASTNTKGLSSNNSRIVPHYQILHVFNEHGPVENKVLKKCYEKLFSNPEDKGSDHKDNDPTVEIGPFINGLKDINKYVQEILKKLNLSQAFLLSAQEYNESLENIQEIRNLGEIFSRHGQEVTATDYSLMGVKNSNSVANGNGFLKKFFGFKE